MTARSRSASTALQPRAAGTVGAQTVVKAADIESCTFQLPNAKVVRVEGLAETATGIHDQAAGKWIMPDMQMVLKTDITAGVPATGSAYAGSSSVGARRKPGTHVLPQRTKVEIASGMSIEWETHQEGGRWEVYETCRSDGKWVMTTHNFKHANGTAPTIGRLLGVVGTNRGSRSSARRPRSSPRPASPWETHQDTVGIDLPRDRGHHGNFKHALTAPTIVGF